MGSGAKWGEGEEDRKAGALAHSWGVLLVSPRPVQGVRTRVARALTAGVSLILLQR